MYESNVLGTENVLRAALEAKTPKVVYVSTIGAYGNTHGEVVDETYEHPGKDFTSYYEQTKYEAHRVAQRMIAEEDLPCVIVQPGGVYGPDDHSAIGKTISDFVAGRLPLLPFPDLGMNMVHVDDVADGILLALDKGVPGQAYNLGGQITTMREMIGTVAEVSGRKPPRGAMPTGLLKVLTPVGPLVGKIMGQRPNLRELISSADGVTFWAKHDKAMAELGYSPARPRDRAARDARRRGQALERRAARPLRRARGRRAPATASRTAAAITAAKASPRAMPSSRAGADRVAEDDHAAQDRGAVGGDGRRGDHRNRLAELHPAGEGEEGADAADDRRAPSRGWRGDRAARVDRLGERLDRHVRDADQKPGGESEHDAVADRARGAGCRTRTGGSPAPTVTASKAARVAIE